MKESKIALITGTTSGIGSVITKHLIKSGYSVIALGRSPEKLNSLVDSLQSINPNVKVNGIICDLSSFESTRKACKEIKESYHSIDLLVLNAGLWNFKFIETEDKIEEIFQVNLLSQVFLFNELFELIPKNGESKVIFTSSGLHQGTVNFKDIEFRANFTGFKAYRQSKLGLILLTRWLAKQPSNSGICFYCVHPGIVNTGLGRSAGWFFKRMFQLLGKSKEKGAKTHIYLINQDPKSLHSGAYYSNSKVTKTTSYSYNLEIAGRLWDVIKGYINKLSEK